MKPVAFDYERPASVREALALLADLGDDGKIIAGGQSLVPMLNLRLARPSVLIDISRLDLTEFTVGPDVITIGGLNRHRRFEHDPEIAAALPLLRECAGHIGYPAIRNFGTFGGSLAHADSTAEWSLATLAMDGVVEAESLARGVRDIPIEEHLVGPFTTALEQDELLTRVRIPASAQARKYAFAEFAERTGDFAIGSALVGFAGDSHQRRDARVATAGLAGAPIRLRMVEALLEESTLPTSAAIGSALTEDIAGQDIDVTSRGHVLSVVHSLIDECVAKLIDGGTQ